MFKNDMLDYPRVVQVCAQSSSKSVPPSLFDMVHPGHAGKLDAAAAWCYPRCFAHVSLYDFGLVIVTLALLIIKKAPPSTCACMQAIAAMMDLARLVEAGPEAELVLPAGSSFSVPGQLGPEALRAIAKGLGHLLQLKEAGNR